MNIKLQIWTEFIFVQIRLFSLFLIFSDIFCYF